MRAILTHNLSKSYGKHRGIVDLDLEVQEGERYGFIGPNGAGKSTTMRLLLGFLFPTAGYCRILGKDCVKSSQLIKQVTSYVPSEVRYDPRLTTRQLMRSSLSFHRMKWSHEADDLIERFDIQPDQKLGRLSLGNKKKAAVAAALVTNPALIILDEPTSGLDPLMQRALLEVLGQRNAQGMTVFMSSHNLTEVEHFCEKAALIKEGRLASVTELRKTWQEERVFTLRCPSLEDRLLEEKGARILERDGERRRFLFDGELKGILELLAQYPVEDLEVRRVDLEEQFLSHYEGSGER